MGWILRSLLLSCLMLVAACSMETAIEKLSSPEDRAFAQRFVDDIRNGDEESLKPVFDPELWAKSREQLVQARPLFPPGQGSTRLISYNVTSNFGGGASSTTKEYVLVTTDDTHWTRTRIVTFAQGGPARVVEWNVNGFREPPAELQVFETMERILPWIQAGLLIGLVGGIALVWWLVRRSRRRSAARP